MKDEERAGPLGFKDYRAKQPVPISRVAEFSLAREVYRELKVK